MSMADQSSYTRVPNAILDALAELTEVRLKLVLTVVRKTIGWQKECDAISLTQFEQATGKSRPAIVETLENLVAEGWLEITGKGKRGTPCWTCGPRLVNSVNQLTDATSKLTQPDLVNSVNRSSPRLVNSVNTQKKDLKEKKDSASRKTRERKPREKKEKDPTPEPIILAMAEVCKIDRSVATFEQRQQLYQSAGILYRAGRKAGQTDEQIAEAIRYVAGYFKKSDWRGQKGQTPTPAHIREVWREAIDARKASANGHSNGLPPVVVRKPRPTPQETAAEARKYDPVGDYKRKQQEAERDSKPPG